MIDNELESLAISLAKAPWRWDRHDLSEVARCLGANLRDTTWNRLTYVTGTGVEIDAYRHDGTIVLAEVILDVGPTDGLDDSAYEELVDTFFNKFESTTSRLAGVLGKPTFADGQAAEGYPADQDAVWLALWLLPNARLMLQVKHEGREVPYRLSIAVTAPALL